MKASLEFLSSSLLELGGGGGGGGGGGRYISFSVLMWALVVVALSALTIQLH